MGLSGLMSEKAGFRAYLMRYANENHLFMTFHNTTYDYECEWTEVELWNTLLYAQKDDDESYDNNLKSLNMVLKSWMMFLLFDPKQQRQFLLGDHHG